MTGNEFFETSVKDPLIIERQKDIGGAQVDLHELKGRILRATEDYNAGDVVITEPHLFIHTIDPECIAWIVLQEVINVMHPIKPPFEAAWFFMGLLSCVTKDGVSKVAEELMGVCGIKVNETWRTKAKLLLFIPEEEILDYESVDEFQFLLTFKEALANRIFELGLQPDTLTTEELILDLLEGAIDDASWMRCSLIWVYNCFEWSSPSAADPTIHLGYVSYFISSFLSHSCLPNLAGDIRMDGVQVFRARRSIKAGEELTISYLNEDQLLAPIALRRHDLLTSKRFFCRCERCDLLADRSRCVRCTNCNVGYKCYSGDAGWPSSWYRALGGPMIGRKMTMIDSDESDLEDYNSIHRDETGREGRGLINRTEEWLRRHANKNVALKPSRMREPENGLDFSNLINNEIERFLHKYQYLRAWKPKCVTDENVRLFSELTLPVLTDSLTGFEAITSNTINEPNICCEKCLGDNENDETTITDGRKFIRAEKYLLQITSALNNSELDLGGWHEYMAGHASLSDVFPNQRFPPGYTMLKWLAESKDNDTALSAPSWVQHDVVQLLEYILQIVPWTYGGISVFRALTQYPWFAKYQRNILSIQRMDVIFIAWTSVGYTASYYWAIESYAKLLFEATEESKRDAMKMPVYEMLDFARQGIETLYGSNYDSVRDIERAMTSLGIEEVNENNDE